MVREKSWGIARKLNCLISEFDISKRVSIVDSPRGEDVSHVNAYKLTSECGVGDARVHWKAKKSHLLAFCLRPSQLPYSTCEKVMQRSAPAAALSEVEASRPGCDGISRARARSK